MKYVGCAEGGKPYADEVSDGAIYAAVSQRDVTPEERAQLDAAIDDLIADIRDMENENVIAAEIRAQSAEAGMMLVVARELIGLAIVGLVLISVWDLFYE